MRIRMLSRADFIRGLIVYLDEEQGTFGKRFDVSQSTVSRWVKKTNPQKPDIEHWEAIQRVAAEVGYRPAGSESGEAVNIIGYVGAGAAVYPIDDHAQGGGFDVVYVPGGTGPAIGLIVRGDSQYPKYEDGDILIFEDRDVDPLSLIGKDCYVQLEDGRAMVKRLHAGTKPGLFRLRSHNAPDIEDVRIERAYKVAWIHPR